MTLRRDALVMVFGILLAQSLVMGAGWAFESGDGFNNQFFFPVGGNQEIQIGGGDRTWYWSVANAISFKGENPRLYWEDINGGMSKRFGMKFKFSYPVLSFSFVTPTINNHIVGGTVSWSYSADGKEWIPLWEYKGKGSQPVTFKPLETAVQKLKVPGDKLWLAYAMDKGFGGSVVFGPGQDGGGLLKVTLLEKVVVEVKPARPGHLYSVNEPIRVTLGPVAGRPTFTVRDLTRAGADAPVRFENFGRYWYGYVPTNRCGLFELTVRKPDGKSVASYRWGVVNPPLTVTLDQIRQTPFGVVFHGLAAIPNWDDVLEIYRMTGIHGTRGWMTPDWLSGEPEPGKYSWQKGTDSPIDFQMSGLLKWGIFGYGSVCWTPRWAIDEKKWNPSVNFIHYPPKPEYYKNFYNFCKALSERYKGFVDIFQTYNEPNNEPFGSWKGTIEEWAKLNRAGQDGLKAGNPGAKLLGPVSGDVDLHHIKRCWEIAGKDLFDIIDVHPYRHDGTSPERGDLLGDIRRLQILIKNYGNNQPIYYSEIGWATFVPYGATQGCYVAVTPLQQAWYVQRTYLLSLAAGVKHIDWFIISDYGENRGDPEHNFGLVDFDGVAKPSLVAYSGMTRHLEGAKFRGTWTTKESKHYAFVWSVDNPEARPYLAAAGKKLDLLTVWCDESKPGQVNKPVMGKKIKLPGKPFYVEDMYGSPAADRIFEVEGIWYAQAGEDPLYIYIDPPAVSDLGPLPESGWPQKLTKAVSMNNVQLDGKADEWATTEKKTVLAFNRPKAEFMVGSGEEGLSFFSRVKDPDPMNKPQKGWFVWDGDCIELFIDTNPEETPSFFTENKFQLGLAPTTTDGMPQVILINSGHKDMIRGQELKECKIASRKEKDGWAVEALIPWKVLGKNRPKAGTQWGLDIAVDDAGKEGTRDCQVFWNGTTDGWNNPGHYGRIQFP
jgi:hypothetical protein